ncbi:MAG: polysaccharide biosynthesis protein [Marmoricola sp.]|nr:polysaccharide biosynthesis protein [Marmoricola sp.]
MRALAYSVLARVFAFLPQGIAGLVVSHLILKHYGEDAFSSYALIVSVLVLIPLNNLGAGASVTQVISARGVDDEQSLATTTTAIRVLSLSGVVLAAFALVLGLFDLWPRLLGNASGSNEFVAIAVILYAVSFVPALGQSVLLATGRNHLAIAVGALGSILSAVFVWLLYLLHLDARALVAIPSLAILCINVATMMVSSRLDRFPWATAVRRAPFRRRYPGASVRSLAIPVFITSLAMPAAFLADRIVLSHVSTSYQLARYALVLQIFAPVTGLIIAASQPLWPMVTKARVAAGSGPKLALIFTAFIVGTLIASGVLVVLSDPLARTISAGKIDLGYLLPLLGAAVTLLQAIVFPLSMTMIDPAGARLVAFTSVLAIPANLGLSIIWARDWGAPGPLVSALVVSIFLQVLPWTIFSRRRARSGETVAVF